MIIANSQYVDLGWLVDLFVVFVCLLHSKLPFSGKSTIFPLIEWALELHAVLVGPK